MKLLKHTIVLALIAGFAPGGVENASALVRPTALNTRDRAAVIEAYTAEFNRTEPSSGWTGDVDTCQSGATTSAYQMSVLQRVNWYRSMAGLPNVSYNTALNQNAQDAALINSAEGALSHTPAATVKCYTQSGRTGTENSNLALGLVGVKAADGYIDDQGDNNTSVGHRAWLLSRTLGGIATGDIESDGTHYPANAIYVNGGGGTVATPRDGYIAWPPSGYVPDAVLYARWSFTTGGTGVSYQSAQVTVTGPNGAVPVEINARSGFLEAGIVFTPALPQKKVTSDTTYTVNITGVTGGNTSSFTYQVTAIHINEGPREQSISGWGAPTCTAPRSNIAKVNLSDPEGDATSYRLVPGYGDTDNALFLVNSDGIIQNIAELSASQITYRLRYEATDANGWTMQNTLTVRLKDPKTDTTVVCPGRNLTLSANPQGGVRVTWDAPVNGGAGSWYVFFSPGGSFCKVTVTSCDVTTLQNGTTYKVDLYNVRGNWSSPHTVTYTKPANPSSPTTTVVVPSMKTLKRGKTAKLSLYGKVPEGSKTYKTKGPCSVDRSRATVTAKRSAVGVCAVTITTTTRSRTGSVARKTSQIRLKVV